MNVAITTSGAADESVWQWHTSAGAWWSIWILVNRILVGPNSYRLVSTQVTRKLHESQNQFTPDAYTNSTHQTLSTTESRLLFSSSALPSHSKATVSPPNGDRKFYSIIVKSVSAKWRSITNEWNISFRFLSPRQLNISHLCFYAFCRFVFTPFLIVNYTGKTNCRIINIGPF